ncbi:MAG: HNH endonuclease [Hyphomicrobiales bacterium]|nr:HNH endonuclease [Hyphomicrobiales bacterium]
MSINSLPNIPKARQMTQERLKEVLHYNPDIGDFVGKIKSGKRTVGKKAGTISNGYRLICIDYTIYRASRLAWLWMTGSWPDNLVDHINCIRDDDRWCNLRAATYQENARNKKPGKRNKTGKVGVAIGEKADTWIAHITVDSKTQNLGCFEVIGDAVEARCAAEKHYFGEFARRASNA